MKTKYWILIFSVLAAACIILTVFFFCTGQPVEQALVYSDGKLIKTIDLKEDGEYTIENGEEWNVLTVKDGKIRVSSASCKNQDCVHQGASNHGAPIVCLPNHLVIRFEDAGDLDAVLR